ncbi:MAG TPA: TolC family protein, partial [Vicinamibacterales bacterium]|jgi:outer membrane protein TolC|nr:TolC family protein [Vicinamibacterales bacterium]
MSRAKAFAERLAVVVLCTASLSAQAPAPTIERLTFADAIARATAKNPNVATAAAGILRAEGLLRQARAATLLQVTGNVTTTTLNTGVEFQGTTVSPRNQVTASLTADMPIVNAAAWARRTQAEDQRAIAGLNAADVRRQVATATADAFLAVIAARRVLEADVRARDTAKAHFDLATELEQRGTGSRLNTLRAQQQVSSDETLLESATLALYRAREALGVLVVADGPVDAADEPTFESPASVQTQPAQSLVQRTDLRLFTAERQAAERVVRDSRRDYFPSLDAVFLPQSTYPSQFFVPANSWRFMLQATIPIFDSGQRAALKVQRQSALDAAAATLAGATTAASSEVRAAREAVASNTRALASAQAAADQARQVVDIINVSFRAGAATSIEVIDAERSARDADTAAAVAEDALRRARLDVLIALGEFPQ